MQKTVGQLLSAKGSEVWTIDPDASVYDALRLLDDRNIGALVVMEGNKVCGIISERDYARKVILLDRGSRDTDVSEIMTADVKTITRDRTVSECMTTITEEHIRHLPVVENEELVGLISVGDIVKAVIAEQAFLIQQLEQYITG